MGLAGQCVSKAIEATEKLIIKEKVDSSDESVADNFKKMSIADGTNETDLQLANYYLSKEYIWILYSVLTLIMNDLIQVIPYGLL